MKTFIIALLACAALQANAQIDRGYTGGASETHPTYAGGMIPTGWTGFVGINSGSTKSDDAPVDGTPSSIKLLASYYTDGGRFVYDIGGGTQTQKFDENKAVEKSTTTSVMELAARFQFANRWQFGPVYNQLFNRGVNYFSNQADAEFGGLQLMKEWSMGDSNGLLRVGVRAMRDINSDNRNIDMAMLDVAMGWDPH